MRLTKRVGNNNNNNNNDKDDNVYGAVIVANPLREFTRHDKYGTAPSSRPPSAQAKRPGL